MTSEISRDQNVPEVSSKSHTDQRRTGDSRVAKVLGGTRSGDKHIGVSRGVVWFAVLALVLAAWPVYKGMVYKSGSGFGYYIGIVGAVMMLLMLLYPLRKHVRWAQSWGPLRYWFMLHMVFGIGGPVLVLFHSTFHVKSMNAAVSLYSMLLVALSGIIGRFIYTRIHHGLYGRQSDLKELQQSVDANQNKMSKVSAVLIGASGVGERLQQFRNKAFSQERNPLARAWGFMTLGWHRHKLATHCQQELLRAVNHLAKAQGWDKQQQEQNYQAVSMDVNDYLAAVQQAAQFSAYERLFRLWHILHSPFVWLLGISAIVHVVAVNMY